ncbi:MAG: hypothetical protein ACKVU1_02455 [bacterium]
MCASVLATPADSRSDETCLEKTIALIRPTTPVKIDFVGGGSARGIGLVARGDSLLFKAHPDSFGQLAAGAYSRAEIAGLTFGSKREVDPHWGIVGFFAGYFLASGAWNDAKPGRIDAPIVGLFGGVVTAAAAATFLPPLSVGSETYIRCE